MNENITKYSLSIKNDTGDDFDRLIDHCESKNNV